jgi:acyl-CoA synthetase (AMP-forming)/AMP-acid ligase II
MSRRPVDVGDLAASGAVEHPDRVAVSWAGQHRTWSQLAERVASGAAAQRLLGLEPGDRVAVLADNHPAALEVTLACARLGTVSVPVTARPLSEIEYVINDSEATLLLVDARWLDTVERLRHLLPAVRHLIGIGGAVDQYESWLDAGRAALDRAALDRGAPDAGHTVDPDTCFLQLYTSATTGPPKGAQLTHRGALATCAAIQPVSGGGPDASWLVARPLGHFAGHGCALSALYARARLVLTAGPDIELPRLIELERITHAFLPTAGLAALALQPDTAARDLTGVRQVWYGGGTMSIRALRRCLTLFPGALVHSYGMTEIGGPATVLGPARRLDELRRSRSAGRPIAGVELEVRDPNTGAPVPTGRTGEVWIRTGQLMAGYWQDPEATEAAVAEDGWYRTGDGGLLDPDGYLHLTDRIQDRIISGGTDVYPAEIEGVLAELPCVGDLAVIGVPDERWGEVPKAVVVAAEGHTVDEATLLAHCRRHLASVKCPRSVDVVDTLPRNAAGKVVKKDLYRRYWAAPYNGAPYNAAPYNGAPYNGAPYNAAP